MRYFIALFCATTLLSCTTLTKDECQTLSWRDRGQTDASEGSDMSRFAKYTKTCKEYGIQPNKKLYVKGRILGLRKFCTEKSGHEFGVQGKKYLNTCPGKYNKIFLRGYRTGIKEYELAEAQKELEEKEEELREREEVLEEEQERLAALEEERREREENECTFDSDCGDSSQWSCDFGECQAQF